MIEEITLTNGVVVPIKTDLSLGAMKRLKAQGLFSDKAIKAVLSGNLEGLMEDKSVDNAPFIAYQLAGGEMNQEEFEELMPNAIDLNIAIYVQLVTSKQKNENNKNAFRDALRKK
ncbi:hypothetical protein [Vaginisenegalia massiliensis]|uniref:hypothetical protein n=1 Tax=Vaginisenegalia massiliensis TaxID=2058294 RepID=UPI000F52FA36|nr:hypothetical protein [Vaginisenegalia massiliensis]